MVRIPQDSKALAKLAAVAQEPKPDAPAKRCPNLEPHEPDGHYWYLERPGRLAQRKYCSGLKHRSKLRGVPRAERLERGRG